MNTNTDRELRACSTPGRNVQEIPDINEFLVQLGEDISKALERVMGEDAPRVVYTNILHQTANPLGSIGEFRVAHGYAKEGLCLPLEVPFAE